MRLPISLFLKMMKSVSVGIIATAHAAIWNDISVNAYIPSLVLLDIELNVLTMYAIVG